MNAVVPPARRRPPLCDTLPLPRGVYVVDAPSRGAELLAVTSDGELALPPFLLESRTPAYVDNAIRAAGMLLDQVDPPLARA